MPKNEDGEFEMVLGNSQLLAVFFLVTLLLGIFFTIGYIVGHSSSPVDARKLGDGKAAVVDAGTRPAPSTPAATTPAPTETPATSNPTPTPVASTPATTPAPAAKPEEKPKPAETAASAPEEPTAGQTYLQVAAVQRAEAELFVDVLAKKGFHSLFAQIPNNPTIYRVLVGPFKDAGAIGQARTDLQKAGFKGFDALVRKY